MYMSYDGFQRTWNHDNLFCLIGLGRYEQTRVPQKSPPCYFRSRLGELADGVWPNLTAGLKLSLLGY